MIRVFTAFSGYDSQCMALDRLGIEYELVGWSEIDKYAIQAHDAIYPQWSDRNYGDISKIDWDSVPDFDLFTYSFPCGLSGTKVKTEIGYKNIEDVVCGDKVLTYKNRYCEVVRTMSRMCPTYYKINAIGCKLKLTAEHPLWVLRDGVEQWIKVKDLTKNDKLSYCIPQGNEFLNISDKKLWLLGRYVADGFINKHLYNSVLFAIGNKKEAEFLSNVPCEFKDKFRKFQKSCIEYRIADKELQDLCMEFGVGAVNKHIPEWLFSANKNQIEHFLNGCFSGDGHVRYRSGSKVQMFTTVSKDLFLGIQMLILKCYGKVCSLSIRNDKRKPTFNDTYNGQISFSESPYQKVIGDRIFVSIKSIDKIEKEVQVYNLEVSEDNSYTCDNVNTHNCTDISSAGQQKGLAEGSRTRSSLLWECRKAIEAKRPKYLLMENVKALVSDKFLPFFLKWQNEMANLGYSNFSQVLNAKDYGVPQNRERIFMVSILGDESYYFPQPFELKKRLKDILEDNVDDRYFLSKKIIDTFTRRTNEHKDKGYGFKFNPTNGQGIASSVLTRNGSRDCDNYIYQKIGNPLSCAMRGRNPNNPSDRTAGKNKKQWIEIGNDVANCITTVQKDSMVIEPNIIQVCNIREGNGFSNHTSTGCGGNTDSFVAEPKFSININRERKSNEKRTIFEANYERNAEEILSILRREIGEEENKRKIRRFICFLKKEVLQQGMYEESICSSNSQKSRIFSSSSHCEEDSLSDRAEGEDMRDMWFDEEHRCTSQRWELSKQLIREFDECMSFVPSKIAQEAKRNLFYMIKANKGSFVLQKVLYSLEETFDSSNNFFSDYIIRKLTEREVFRLMGVSENDIDKMQAAGISKTQQYKMAGNSIVVDVLFHIFRKLFIDKKNDNQQQTLF